MPTQKPVANVVLGAWARMGAGKFHAERDCWIAPTGTPRGAGLRRRDGRGDRRIAVGSFSCRRRGGFQQADSRQIGRARPGAPREPAESIRSARHSSSGLGANARAGQGAQSCSPTWLRCSALPTPGGCAGPTAPAGDASRRPNARGGGAHDAGARRRQGRPVLFGSPVIAGRRHARPYGRVDIVALNERAARPGLYMTLRSTSGRPAAMRS